MQRLQCEVGRAGWPVLTRRYDDIDIQSKKIQHIVENGNSFGQIEDYGYYKQLKTTTNDYPRDIVYTYCK